MGLIAKERLYLTADSERLVREGDPEGATLYCAPGDGIPTSAVEKFGADIFEPLDEDAVNRALAEQEEAKPAAEAQAKADEEASEKAKAAAADKEKAPAANKAKG